ncbi:uncharacterized protein [Haliotis cracherodii]|uniref:uncharacterized protein n=1 Tax=Haliotis cracherodii TaxID=6455 RepID=UPI0039EBA3B7
MRPMIPLLVVLVGVTVVTTQSDSPGTTTPLASSKPTTVSTQPHNNTASTMTSSTFGIVLSVVGVATVKQVL